MPALKNGWPLANHIWKAPDGQIGGGQGFPEELVWTVEFVIQAPHSGAIVMSDTDLRSRRCRACTPGTPALSSERAAELLKQVPGWGMADGGIEKSYQFKNYHETIAFVNAIAWIAHGEDHHP